MPETLTVSKRWVARHICLKCKVLVDLGDSQDWVTLHQINNMGELFKGRNEKGQEIEFKPEAILEIGDI